MKSATLNLRHLLALGMLAGSAVLAGCAPAPVPVSRTTTTTEETTTTPPVFQPMATTTTQTRQFEQ